MKRIKNRLFALFCAMFTACAAFPAAVLAFSHDSDGKYSKITLDIADHIVVRTGIQNGIRTVQFGVLKFLSSFIDYIYEAVIEIASYNLYDLVKKEFDFSSFLVPLAWSILSLITVFIAIRLLLKSDTRFGEDALKFFICVGLIIIFPAFISACEDMRTKLVADAVGISGKSSQTQSLGNQILERYIIDVKKSVDDGEVSYYGESTHDIQGKDLYINKVYDNLTEFPVKISDDPKEATGITGKGAYNFDMILESMGLTYKYADYIEASETDTTIKTQATYSEVHNDDGTVDKVWTYNEYTAEEYANKVILPIAKRSSYNDWLKTNINFDGSDYSDWEEYESDLKEALEKKMTSGSKEENESIHDENGKPTGRYIAWLFNDTDVEMLLDNSYVGSDGLGNVGGYFDYLGRYISTLGYPAENVYCYDFDFGYCLITMLAVLLSLCFAALKLGKMLYELIFLEIISPVLIAVDAGSWQGQKAKQVVTNLLTTSAIFAIIILVFKLYLFVLIQIYKDHTMSIAMQLVLIISGAAFVIDGPDSIVKILGMDAGVKSGYGALRGAGAVARTATGAARGIGNTAKKIANAPSAVAAKAGENKAKSMAKKMAQNDAKAEGKGRIGQAIAGAKAGMANGRTGTAFRKAASDRLRSNSDYNDYKEKANGSSGSAAVPISENSNSGISSSPSANNGATNNTRSDNGIETPNYTVGNSVSSSDSSNSMLGGDHSFANDSVKNNIPESAWAVDDTSSGVPVSNSPTSSFDINAPSSNNDFHENTAHAQDTTSSALAQPTVTGAQIGSSSTSARQTRASTPIAPAKSTSTLVNAKANTSSRLPKRGKGLASSQTVLPSQHSASEKYPMPSADTSKLYHDGKNSNDYRPPAADKSALSYDKDRVDPFANTQYFNSDDEE